MTQMEKPINFMLMDNNHPNSKTLNSVVWMKPVKMSRLKFVRILLHVEKLRYYQRMVASVCSVNVLQNQMRARQNVFDNPVKRIKNIKMMVLVVISVKTQNISRTHWVPANKLSVKRGFTSKMMELAISVLIMLELNLMGKNADMRNVKETCI